MDFTFSADRLRYLFSQLRERLWVKPLLVCLLSIAGAFAAKFADATSLGEAVPEVSAESVSTLLSVMASSMLVIATLAVTSMVSAYASASSAATPRAFTLVLADDHSQNALSTFIGAFIFSIVALTASKNDFFGTAGRFTLFALTVLVFTIVVLTFVRWVDRIARLGRLGTIIEKVERATSQALSRRRSAPELGGVPVRVETPRGEAVYGREIGYVQRVDIGALQSRAEQLKVRVALVATPGTFAAPGQVLAYVSPPPGGALRDTDRDAIAEAFQVGGDRRFDDDPRFGLVVLSEIAGRALSPAVNDPGTAVDILGSLVRLFVRWREPLADDDVERARTEGPHDRVEVPSLTVREMFDDAFTSIARDGAGTVEVALRLQDVLRTLAGVGDDELRAAAIEHGRLARERALLALTLPDDKRRVQQASLFAGGP